VWAKALTVTGIVLAVAGIVFGIWVQFAWEDHGADLETAFRLQLGLTALVPVGVGVVVTAAGRILAVLGARPSSRTEPPQ
jgi:hypothetical protein